eukprot:m.293352 g.293352  ORF g.293352 m.293352 type:complete len:117 (-) comp12770_c0_seq1:93-443(-)
MTWYAQPRQKPDTPVIMRLLGAGTAIKTEDAAVKTEPSDDAAAQIEHKPDATTILLFCRLEGGDYVSCGRLCADSVDLKASPICFTWRLLDFAAICDSKPFQALLAPHLPSEQPAR